jgi:transposase
MNVRYRVDLSQVERDELRVSVSGGKQPVRRLKRMQILLAADAGVGDKEIEASVQTSGSTIYRTKKRFVEISLEAALCEEPRPGAARKLSGKEEVQLVALACSDPPEGCTRWTLALLANALLEVVEHESVSVARHRVIAATGLSLVDRQKLFVPFDVNLQAHLALSRMF